MPSQLSKLHVRFIQTQKSFSLQQNEENQHKKFPLKNLYIKSNNSFYFLNQSDTIQDGSLITLSFNEANDYLTSMHCKVTVKEIEKKSDEYKEALLFFPINEASVHQLLLLTLESVEQN